MAGRSMKREIVVAVLLACTSSNKLPSTEAWDVADYAKAGLAIDKPWTAEDFTHAAQVLEQVCSGHRERLPHWHGAKSGAVFDKLLVELPDAPEQPIAERFGAHAARGEALNAISKLYVVDLMDAPSREWIELVGANLREAVVLSKDADAFLASLGADDPKHQVRLAGLAKMKSGYGSMLLGGLLVADQRRLSDDDRIAMLQHIAAALPTLFPQAPAETQRQIRDLLAKQVAALPPGKLHDAAAAAHQALPE